MIRRIATCLIAAFGILMASQARADTRVTVHDFYGPNAARLRDDVVNLLERQSDVTIISQKQIESAAMKLGVDPFSPDGRKVLSRELQLSAWMTGVVRKRSGKLTLTVVVYDGAQHQRVGRTQLSGKSPTTLTAEINRRFWAKSRRAIMHASSTQLSGADAIANAKVVNASDDDSAPNPGDPDVASDSSKANAIAAATARREVGAPGGEADGGDAHGSSSGSLRDDGGSSSDDAGGRKAHGETLRAFVGLGSPYRSLSYREPVTNTLGDYSLSGAPMVDINLAFHPARLATDGWLSWFGLDIRAQVALSTPTRDNDGNQFKSRYDSFHVGLRARVPVGSHYVSAFSGYAMNRFQISPQNRDVSSPAPSVDYRTLRSGLGAEFALTDSFMLGTDAAYLNFLSVGDIGRWFPRATAGGIELAAFATYNVTPSFFTRATAAYQRTFFDFNSKPGDKNIAGGATDQYLAFSLGAGVSL